MIRHYLVPMIGDGITIETARRPAYVGDLGAVSWSARPYGKQPVFLVTVDLTDKQHDTLTANADVVALPDDPKADVSAALVDALVALKIPAKELTAETVLDEIHRHISVMQQFAGKGIDPFDGKGLSDKVDGKLATDLAAIGVVVPADTTVEDMLTALAVDAPAPKKS